MRISRLDLTRYGCFTDRFIQFEPLQPGEPDLHVLYGRNEAGKSTLLNAYLDLLFGIGAQTPHAFLHPYSTMRIGARLEFADGEQEFIRIKRAQGSLLDEFERPIGEATIQRELGGLERDAYRTMFSLNDHYLQQGGESIIASKGDLGVLLFSASAGLAELGRRLGELNENADKFYRYRSRRGELITLKGELEELKVQRTQLDTQAGTYALLLNECNRLKQDYDQASADERATASRIAEIERVLSALPVSIELKRLREQIEPLKGLPTAPASWVSAVQELQQEEAVLRSEEARIETAIVPVQLEVKNLIVDEKALQIREQMSSFRRLCSRLVGSSSDLPRKRAERLERKGRVEAILARIERTGESDPTNLILGVSATGRLRRLIETWSGVDNQIRTAAAERDRAKRALGAALDRAAEEGMAGEDSDETQSRMVKLSAAIGHASANDYLRRVAETGRALKTARTKLNEQLELLKPWNGSAGDLPGMNCLTVEDAQKKKAELLQLMNNVDVLKAECVRLGTEQNTLNSRLRAITATKGVVSDSEAAGIRSERDTAWKHHRQYLDNETADAFEEALRRDDEVSGKRFAHVSDLATVRQVEERLMEVGHSLEYAETHRKEAQNAYELTLSGVDARIARVSPLLAEAKMEISAFELWLTRRERALELLTAVQDSESSLDEAQNDLDQTCVSLRNALNEIGFVAPETADLGELVSTAQRLTQRFNERKTLREQLTELERALQDREEQLAAARTEKTRWTEQWDAGCKDCWIGENGMPDTGTVSEILTELPQLQAEMTELRNIERRIQSMDADEQALLAESVRLATVLGISAAGTSGEVADRVNQYIQSVEEANLQRDRARKKLAELQGEKAELVTRWENHGARTAEMAEALCAKGLSEIEIRLAEVQRRDGLQERIDLAESNLVHILGREDVTQAEAVVEAAAREMLEGELTQLRRAQEDQKNRSHELYADYCSAKDKVSGVGGDSAIAEIEERRKTKLAEIAEKAERYLRLRAGTLAAEMTLRTYRERHRSSMLGCASETFRRISANHYRGLEAQPDGPTECLVARSADGMSKTHHDLSDATRRQLFLALRIAGYYEFVRTRCSLPFVADDIMESFDSRRAKETFKLLAAMSQLGQVIYLTHHEHLCEIAREVCPSVHVYDVDAVAAPPVSAG